MPKNWRPVFCLWSFAYLPILVLRCPVVSMAMGEPAGRSRRNSRNASRSCGTRIAGWARPHSSTADGLHPGESFFRRSASVAQSAKTSYDRLIRGPDEFRRFVRYVSQNLIRANLRNWRWVWVRSQMYHRRPAGTTRSRQGTRATAEGPVSSYLSELKLEKADHFRESAW